MDNHPRWDRVFSTASWLIVVGLLYAAVAIFLASPSGAGPVAQLIGVHGSQIFYACLYTLEAVLLAFSKFFKKKKMRKRMLMVIYLTGFFTSILTISITGFVPKLIDNILISVVAAGCWLYWTFKTEYINPATFYEQTVDLRDDLP